MDTRSWTGKIEVVPRNIKIKTSLYIMLETTHLESMVPIYPIACMTSEYFNRKAMLFDQLS